jgi:hypothetical protein
MITTLSVYTKDPGFDTKSTPLLLTSTVTAPTTDTFGATQSTRVDDNANPCRGLVSPNLQVTEIVLQCMPTTLTIAPPDTDPRDGYIPDKIAISVNSNVAPDESTQSTPVDFARRLTAPIVSTAGVTHVISEEETNQVTIARETDTSVPIAHAVEESKFIPATVTRVPPVRLP